jgi:hypothetical protein
LGSGEVDGTVNPIHRSKRALWGAPHTPPACWAWPIYSGLLHRHPQLAFLEISLLLHGWEASDQDPDTGVRGSLLFFCFPILNLSFGFSFFSFVFFIFKIFFLLLSSF